MKKFLFLVICILTSCATIKQDKPLSIDDFLGNYYTTPEGNEFSYSISKEANGKIKFTIVEFFSTSQTDVFLCDVDKSTDTEIYLECIDVKPGKDKILYELFKNIYLIIDTQKGRYKGDNYLYFFYHSSGKENYEKYHCDEDRKNQKYNSRDCTQVDVFGYRKEE